MRSFKIIICLLLIITALVFAIQNIETIEFEFLLWRLSLPSAALIALMMGAGFVMGVLFSSLMIRRRQRIRQENR